MKLETFKFFRKNNRGRCSSVATDLWDYANGRLSEDRLERVEKHLMTCSRCQHETAGYAQAQTALLEISQEMIPAPRTGWNDLENRLEREAMTATAPAHTFVEVPPRRSSLTTMMTVLAPLSSVATLLMVGILVRQNHQTASREPHSGTAFHSTRQTAQPVPNAVASTPVDQPTPEDVASLVSHLEQASYQETSDAPVSHEKRAAHTKSSVTSQGKGEKSARTASKSVREVPAPKPTRQDKPGKRQEETQGNSFTFHPQKPTPGERAVEHSTEKQGYVASGLIPVNNDDIY